MAVNRFAPNCCPTTQPTTGHYCPACASGGNFVPQYLGITVSGVGTSTDSPCCKTVNALFRFPQTGTACNWDISECFCVRNIGNRGSISVAMTTIGLGMSQMDIVANIDSQASTTSTQYRWTRQFAGGVPCDSLAGTTFPAPTATGGAVCSSTVSPTVAVTVPSTQDESDECSMCLRQDTPATISATIRGLTPTATTTDNECLCSPPTFAITRTTSGTNDCCTYYGAVVQGLCTYELSLELLDTGFAGELAITPHNKATFRKSLSPRYDCGSGASHLMTFSTTVGTPGPHCVIPTSSEINLEL